MQSKLYIKLILSLSMKTHVSITTKHCVLTKMLKKKTQPTSTSQLDETKVQFLLDPERFRRSGEKITGGFIEAATVTGGSLKRRKSVYSVSLQKKSVKTLQRKL
ncbi:hypothetical protein H5410_028515 [Solanum commersonii]|uniref:Uncharacterized protein n=1 Tax=Solanum commersonii TaxID=4109 RepID=A0A9J5Z551_SOLCO|nr:hypothetical protein H5410_028515 [Solanum commersonii]